MQIHDGGSHAGRGVNALMRECRVARLSGDRDFKLIGGRHPAARFKRHLSRGEFGPHMHAKHSVDAVQNTVRHHVESTECHFFSRLEDELDRAGDFVPDAVRDHYRGEKHRNMAVVPAGMHEAVVLAREGESGLFLHGEAVDITAEQEGLAGLPAVNSGQRAGRQVLAAGTPFDPGSGQFFADLLRGLHFFCARLRVRVEIAAHLDLVRVEFFCQSFQIHFQFLSD